MNSRLIHIIYKEFIHIVRDPRTLVMMFLIPVVELLLLGYAGTFDVEHLPTVVLDQDLSPQSRDLIEAYRASNYFDISHYVGSEEELGRLVDEGRFKAGLIIPAGYGRDLEKNHQAQVFFVIDGSDPTIATTAFSGAQTIAQGQSLKLVQEITSLDPENLPGVSVHPRVWYNPNMKSVNFMIPGLIGLILQMMTVQFTSMSIVREREQGTMEQVAVTPIKPWELILGKVAPYAAIAFLVLVEILVIGVFWFGVPIHGSVTLLLAVSTLFLLAGLGIGILISTIAKSQQEAMFFGFFVLLPSMFLSGLFYPLEGMPQVVQVISHAIPLRYMTTLVRGIVLKGVGLEILIGQVIAIAILSVIALSIAAKRLRKGLE